MGRAGPASLAIATAAFAACLVSGGATAQTTPTPPEAPLAVDGSGSCPAPAAVRDAIFQLTSPKRRSALSPLSRVTVADGGDTYRVDVTTEEGSAERTYRDLSRDCERRVRFAAAFAVLTLMPPELALEPEPEPEREPPRRPPEPPRPPPPEPEPERPREPSLVRLELAARTDVAGEGQAEAPSFGGELRVALGRGAIAGALGAAYLPRAELAIDAFGYRVRRVLAGAGARARLPWSALDGSAELGVAALFVRAEGVGLVRSASDDVIQLGLRAALLAGVPIAAEIGPVLGVEALLFPAPAELEAEPRGTAGRLPAFWLGASLGISFGL